MTLMSDSLMSDNVSLFLLLCTVVAPFVLWNWIGKKTQNLAPSPWRLPIIGNLHQFGSAPHRSLARLSRHYGPVMFLQLGSIPVVVVSSNQSAKEVLKTHDRVFSSRPVTLAARKLSYNCSDVSFGEYGDSWKSLKKIVVLNLLSAKRVLSYEAVRREEIKLMLNAIAEAPGHVNLSDLTLVLANDVVCRVTLGRRCRAETKVEKNKLHDAAREVLIVLGGFCIADLFPWPMGWINKLNGFEARVNKCFQDLDEVYDEIIEEHKDPRRTTPQHEDFVDVLLRLQNDPNQDIALTHHNIKGALTDMFNAGTDTAAGTLVWAMTELIKNPSIMAAAQKEVRDAVKGKPFVEEADLPKLTYLKAIIKESMRLHPTVPLLLPRQTTEDSNIMGYHVPAKTTVFVNMFAIAMDPKSWEFPEEFRPERFLKSSIDFKGQDFEFLPFGSGRRGCPGIHFGVLLVELALANLVNRFDWELPEGMKAEDVDMTELFGLTLHKEQPLWLVAKPAIQGNA